MRKVPWQLQGCSYLWHQLLNVRELFLKADNQIYTFTSCPMGKPFTTVMTS